MLTTSKLYRKDHEVAANQSIGSFRLAWLLQIGLVLICLCVLFFRLDTYPRFWFDEGYKLNAAYTLANDGLYATYTTNGYVPFDPGTSGGPADIVPTALALKVFGNNVLAARLTSVFYTLLASISLYQIGRYLWGEMAGLFCTLLVLAMPPITDVSFVLMGRQSLSEAAAFSLMMLGLWILTNAWRTQSLWSSVLSGMIMGLGMLSKTQIAIGLVPALLAVAGWRWLRVRKGALYLFASPIMLVIVFLAWMLIGRLLTPPDIQQQNSTLLLDAIQANIITTLFGSNLDGSALLAIGLMLAGVVTSAWGLWRTKPFGEKQWIELILVLFTLFLTVWFAVFSVGWTRYAFAGIVIGLFLLGRFIWSMIQKLPANRNRLNGSIIGIAVIAAIGINLYIIGSSPLFTDIRDATQYIATSIPKDAVIENWEWELDALSGHLQVHHPQQSLLFEAIRQFSRHEDFNLKYDALQANPDYLIIGTTGAWTGIYSDVLTQKSFTEVATFGIYHIYKRVRAS